MHANYEKVLFLFKPIVFTIFAQEIYKLKNFHTVSIFNCGENLGYVHISY